MGKEGAEDHVGQQQTDLPLPPITGRRLRKGVTHAGAGEVLTGNVRTSPELPAQQDGIISFRAGYLRRPRPVSEPTNEGEPGKPSAPETLAWEPEPQTASAQASKPTARSKLRLLACAAGVLSLAALALWLRVAFILNVSKIPLIWDADLFWGASQYLRGLMCGHLGSCSPVTPGTFDEMLLGIVRVTGFERAALLSSLSSVLLLVFPNELRTVLWGLSALDVLVCLMVVHILVRSRLPFFIAILGGLIQATYIPAITGDGAFLQQPLIRFSFVLVVWAYTIAFTTSRLRWLWVGIGTIGTIMLGLGSLTNRPLLWIVPAVVIVISLVERRLHRVAALQLVCVGLLMLLPGFLLVDRLHLTDSDSLLRMAVGVEQSGAVSGQHTVVSFAHFWNPDRWWDYGLSSTQSLFSDFARTPVEFVKWLNYSLVSNLRYPDYLFFQNFGLDLDQQVIQHLTLLALGLCGLAWLLGRRDQQRGTWVLSLAIGGYISLTNSMISIEPRRLAVLSPFLAMGAAAFTWTLVGLVRSRVGVPRWALFSLAACVLAWAMPLPLFWQLLPLEPSLVYAAVLLVRFGLLLALVKWLVSSWKRRYVGFQRWSAALLLVGALAVLAGSYRVDEEWRTWSASVDTAVLQEASNIQLNDYLVPWLLVDLKTQEQGQSLQIMVNGQALKPYGEPLYTWRAGVPPIWGTYDALDGMATVKPERLAWLAYPVPRDLLNSGTAVVKITSKEGSMLVRGDYMQKPEGPYVGPLLDPWPPDFSFWRWQWNHTDPRIPWAQDLKGQHYTSAYQVGQQWQSGDLAQDLGLQAGVYRIFIVQAPFGPQTNALLPRPGFPGPAVEQGRCRDHQPVMDPGSGLPYLCKQTDVVEYYDSGGQLWGTSSVSLFQQSAETGTLINRLATKQGRIDIIQVLNRLFVANYYSPGDNLTYSVAFEL